MKLYEYRQNMQDVIGCLLIQAKATANHKCWSILFVSIDKQFVIKKWKY